MSELKPCPFCGTPYPYITFEHGYIDDSAVVFCNHCKISVKLEENDQEGTIEPQQRWIPCSERLPDELAEVNITWINTDPAPYYEFTKGKPNTGSAVYYKGRWYWYSAVCADYLAEYGFSPDDDMDDAIKVIAWMPLPEPYKEGGAV